MSMAAALRLGTPLAHRGRASSLLCSMPCAKRVGSVVWLLSATDLGAAPRWRWSWLISFRCLTTIDHRLSDLLFATVQEIETILASEQPFSGEEWTGRIMRWLQSGRILFDRASRLSRLKQKVTFGNWISPPPEMSAYQTWFGINYNYVQTRRMSRSPDPVYHLAVRMRLLYSLSDILGGYFTLRQL